MISKREMYFEIQNGARYFRGSIVIPSTSNSVTQNKCFEECVKINECVGFNFDNLTSGTRNCYLFAAADISLIPESLYPVSNYKTFLLTREATQSTTTSDASAHSNFLFISLLIIFVFGYIYIYR